MIKRWVVWMGPGAAMEPQAPRAAINSEAKALLGGKSCPKPGMPSGLARSFVGAHRHLSLVFFVGTVREYPVV